MFFKTFVESCLNNRLLTFYSPVLGILYSAKICLWGILLRLFFILDIFQKIFLLHKLFLIFCMIEAVKLRIGMDGMDMMQFCCAEKCRLPGNVL